MATKWTDRISMFRSARLKLTLFYLGIIVLFNFTVTMSVRVLAEREFIQSNYIQRNEIRNLVVRVFNPQSGRPELAFIDLQEDQAAIVRDHLNRGLLLINLGALVIGGVLSYWFASRTLKPIEEAHEAQERFTADASHELRTPLTNMKLENEVFLRQKTFTEEEAREQISSNLEEVQRLEHLSNNLLALHQYGSITLERAPIEVDKLVTDAVAPLLKVAEAKQVRIEQELTQATIRGHHESLVQLLDILLDNALKYGARGGVVTIKGIRQGGGYMLAVQDKGPGLDPNDIPHLFDRLYRSDKARSSTVPGYGLGLALAKEIAEANEAEITASNNANGGACFSLRLELA